MSTIDGSDKHPGNREVFSGWKDIAAYLGKGTRTVQRYERTLKLPVRRPGGKTKGSVLATKSELDRWVLSASTRESLEMLDISPARIAANQAEKLAKALAYAQKLRSRTMELRAEFSVLRETFSRHMQVVRTSLALSAQVNQRYSADFILQKWSDMPPRLPKSPSFSCSICACAVDLESANTDEAGHAVHEECYVLKLRLIHSSSPPTTDLPSSSQDSLPPHNPRGNRAA